MQYINLNAISQLIHVWSLVRVGPGSVADADALQVVPGSVALAQGAAASLSTSGSVGSLMVGVGAATFAAPSTSGWALQLRAILYGHQQPITALAAYLLQSVLP